MKSRSARKIYATVLAVILAISLILYYFNQDHTVALASFITATVSIIILSTWVIVRTARSRDSRMIQSGLVTILGFMLVVQWGLNSSVPDNIVARVLYFLEAIMLVTYEIIAIVKMFRYRKNKGQS